MVDDEKRAAFRRWLKAHNHSPYSAARAAKVSPGTIYNFLSGLSESLSSGVLEKLATVTGSSVDSILTGTAVEPLIPVRFRVGSGGRMFMVDDDEGLSIAPPPGLKPGQRVIAAQADGDAIFPIPSGWHVFFDATEEEPVDLIGHMAVVRYSGGGDRPVIRTIRRGTAPGTFTLQAFTGALIEDVEVLAAHRVVSFSAPSRD